MVIVVVEGGEWERVSTGKDDRGTFPSLEVCGRDGVFYSLKNKPFFWHLSIIRS